MEGLAGRGLTGFTPKIECSAEAWETPRVVPMFQRYAFVRLCSAEDYYTAKWTPGAIGIVCADGKPLSVDPDIIRGLRRSTAAHGYVKMRRPSVGDRVVVCSGALKGIAGRFVQEQSGGQRVKLLLEIMQRQVVVQAEGWRIQNVAGGAFGGSW